MDENLEFGLVLTFENLGCVYCLVISGLVGFCGYIECLCVIRNTRGPKYMGKL